MTARACLEVAEFAADEWADDARLVWVENDAPVDTQGRSHAWGYLYYSPQRGAMRSYSIREGLLERYEAHATVAEFPGLHSAWSDSDEAVREAWKQGEENCNGGCELETLLLVRGVFESGSAWVAVFSNEGGPRLHVVLDAVTLELLRLWRG
jgi:hypothetical protein